MRTALLRTDSGSIWVQSQVVPRSPRVSVAARESISKAYKPMISLNLEVNRPSIRRTLSESDVIRSAFEGSGVKRTLSKLGSTSLPAIIPEADCEVLDELEVLRSIGSLSLTEDRKSYAGDWPVNGIPIDELGFPCGGIGKNRKFGGGGGNSDPTKIGEYYKEMLNSDPMNSLLLRNYGKYLHEVERDFVKAEECYGRAILASPGDGEVLSLYGKLVWETQRDESRAKSYFDQAVHASPDDCSVRIRAIFGDFASWSAPSEFCSAARSELESVVGSRSCQIELLFGDTVSTSRLCGSWSSSVLGCSILDLG